MDGSLDDRVTPERMLMRRRHLQAAAARTSSILLLLPVWYISSYLLMMDWRVLAYDPILHEWTGESCYYFAPYVRVHGNLTMFAGSVCWANAVFRPLDWLLYSMKAALGVRLIATCCWTGWTLLFFGNLFLPFLSVVRRTSSALGGRVVQISFLFGVTLWYCGLWFLYHLSRNYPAFGFVGKPLAVIGSALSLVVLYRLARALGYRYFIPLVFAIVSGTIWLLVSLPSKWPYM